MLITFIILSLFGIRIFVNPVSSSFLNKETTNALRGIAILGIFFAHVICQLELSRGGEYSCSVLWFFLCIAPLGVSVFLFLSGYGNVLSLNKNSSYKNILSRILRIFISCSIVVIIEYLFAKCFKINSLFPTDIKLLSNIFTLSIPPHTTWYPKVQILAYITLFLCYTKFKQYNKSL